MLQTSCPCLQVVQVVPVDAQRQISMAQTFRRTKEIPQLLFYMMIDVPVVQVLQLPRWWSQL